MNITGIATMMVVVGRGCSIGIDYNALGEPSNGKGTRVLDAVFKHACARRLRDIVGLERSSSEGTSRARGTSLTLSIVQVRPGKPGQQGLGDIETTCQAHATQTTWNPSGRIPVRRNG